MRGYETLQRQHADLKRRTGIGILLCCALAVLLVVLSACANANASPSADQRPVFRVEAVQTDSLRIIGTWSRSCDVRGCADAYAVRWAAINFTRATTKSGTVDSVVVKRPAYGDSLLVTLSVNAMRRTLSGPARSAALWLRTTDAAPPVVDSVAVDTLAMYDAAQRDSFPDFEVRTADGLAAMSLSMTAPTQRLCVLSRNRYTGSVVVFAPYHITAAKADSIETACEHARQLFAAERDG